MTSVPVTNADSPRPGPCATAGLGELGRAVSAVPREAPAARFGRRLPSWLKRPMPDAAMLTTRRIVLDSGVATVCQEARCPNMAECWARATATFMILGDRCTRGCRFCAVATGTPEPPAVDEPERLAEAVGRLRLRHVVITAVARDDLPDEGAGHFAACVTAVRGRTPKAVIEVLPADFHGRRECIATLCAARPDVYNHNLETVERITPLARPKADYRRSLAVLRIARELAPSMTTKSGLMVGLRETMDEVKAALADLRAVGCDIVTIGQYLQPASDKLPVSRYYPPEEFDHMADVARAMGFKAAAAGPFVRSSYNAREVFASTAAKTPA